MTDCIWTHPTARKRHRCRFCWRIILPGEPYGRMAGLERSRAWTYRACDHCCRVASSWTRWSGFDEWDEQCIIDWLDDEYPVVLASMQAGWRYPDGELTPLPFQPRCRECRRLLSDEYMWCAPCDTRRIARIDRQFRDIAASFGGAQ